MRLSWTISRYLIGAVAPYFIFAWLLLSVILFAQQASRFSDIFFSANIPTTLVWQLTLALVPSVISFTCPMAALVGVIIGLSKMQGDSELVAIRAAGVGNVQITLPLLMLGVVLSGFAFAVNVFGVPIAAAIVRTVALQTAIYKLESPIEPGIFNTELAGYTVYVKDGDLVAGTWKNIFIYNEDDKGTVRLITSKSGRIDSTGEASELVLDNAVISTIAGSGASEKYTSESIAEFRFAIKTRRGELIEKLISGERSPEELGLSQLSTYAESKEGTERTEAQILWQRRIVLSLTPIVFCLLGTAMILRFTGRGRGFGIFVALMALIAYFLLAFLGEQLARTGRVSVVVGSLLPLIASVAAILWFNFGNRVNALSGRSFAFGSIVERFKPKCKRGARRNIFVDLTTGLGDFDILFDLAKYYLLTLGFLGSVFLIFTAFELWKFAGTMNGGIYLLARYLFYLTPFVYLQLAPSAAMIATLATYVIKSRQNEIVTWISAGQSTYRLLLPCFVAMLLVGVFNLQFQEHVGPRANERQDELRTLIRNRGVSQKAGKYWVATNDRIYSFDLIEPEETGNHNEVAASDNEKESAVATGTGRKAIDSNLQKDYNNRIASDNEIGGNRNSSCVGVCDVFTLTVYEFADNGTKLQDVYHSPYAFWNTGGVHFGEGAVESKLGVGKIETISAAGRELTETGNPFGDIRTKPSHLNIAETRYQMQNSGSEVERRSFAVALEKKYATLILPFVIALFTAPFALSLSRKGKVITVGYAVGLWLVFMAFTSIFEQFGSGGFIKSGVAVWSPLALFSMLGVYLLSKVRT
ncbi:MAG: LptF/LptG family permease [Pyrinomonadaceae bacterium]